MPRSVPAYPQNAVVTHSPANAGSGSTSSAVDQGNSLFQLPPGFDVCAPVTQNGQNPFMAGLNTMGNGENHTGVAGQTGNMLSGFQQFVDSLCGFAIGGTSTSEVLEAARNLRRRGGNLHETVEAIRRLRDTVGTGSTPQSVLAGVEGVTGLVNSNPLAQSAIASGQAAVGISGNQVVDSINGAQAMANQGHTMLTGQPTTGASGTDLLNSAGGAINQNTAKHVGNQSLTTAQSVNLQNQNLLVSQDFSAASTVVGDTHWSWDGTDGAASTNVLGCAKVTCNGSQQPLVSSEIPVVVGENIEVSCQVKWSGLTYTGTSPIILAVEKYRLMRDPHHSGQNVYADVGWSTVYTVPTPGSTSDWLGIAGTHTVEPNVDQLRFRLEVAPNASAGTVKWDDAEFLKLDLIADEAVPGVGLTTDSIVTQLYGTGGSGFTHNQAAEALANTANALTSASSQILALQAEGKTGAIAGDDFSWTGEVVANVNWGGGYAGGSDSNHNIPIRGASGTGGYYQSDGSNATWLGFQGDPFWCYFDWEGTDSVSTTDYQLIQAVLASPPTSTTLPGGTSDVRGFIRLYGRIAAGWTSYDMAAISSDGQYSISYYSAGTLTTLASGTCPTPGLGSAVSFYLGDAPTAAPRRFRLEIGNHIVADVTESGTGSPLGSSNRKWGWGAQIEGSGGIFAGTGANVNQWLAMDQ